MKPAADQAGASARRRTQEAQSGFQTILNIGGAQGVAPGSTTAQPKTMTGQ
jgi:hypothetical protein